MGRRSARSERAGRWSLCPPLRRIPRPAPSQLVEPCSADLGLRCLNRRLRRVQPPLAGVHVPGRNRNRGGTAGLRSRQHDNSRCGKRDKSSRDSSCRAFGGGPVFMIGNRRLSIVVSGTSVRCSLAEAGNNQPPSAPEIKQISSLQLLSFARRYWFLALTQPFGRLSIGDGTRRPQANQRRGAVAQISPRLTWRPRTEIRPAGFLGCWDTV